MAIETALTLRLLFRLPLRQVEGCLRSLFAQMGLALDVPDHTTLARRGRQLRIRLRVPRGLRATDLVIDSSGLSIFGEGQWAAAKHGGKGIRGWKKLHLGVREDGVIVGQILSDAHADDAGVGASLVRRIPDRVRAVIGDGAYDTRGFYDAVICRGARAVVPPIRDAQLGAGHSPMRDRAVWRARRVGRRQWKREVGWHRQARAENAFFRYKRILGDELRARGADAQVVETRLACKILNRMTELGRSASYAIGM